MKKITSKTIIIKKLYLFFDIVRPEILRWKENNMAKKTYEKMPHAKMLLVALRSVGYTNETAIADIVDNSISGSATEIELYFDWDNRRIVNVALQE